FYCVQSDRTCKTQVSVPSRICSRIHAVNDSRPGRDARVEFREFPVATAGLDSCLHNRNWLASDDCPGACFHDRDARGGRDPTETRAVPYPSTQHVVARQALSYG